MGWGRRWMVGVLGSRCSRELSSVWVGGCREWRAWGGEVGQDLGLGCFMSDMPGDPGVTAAISNAHGALGLGDPAVQLGWVAVRRRVGRVQLHDLRSHQANCGAPKMFGSRLGQSAWNKWEFHSFFIIAVPPSSPSHTFSHRFKTTHAWTLFHDQVHPLSGLHARRSSLLSTHDFTALRCTCLHNHTCSLS